MIDITLDFETCACRPTAAVMSVGAVAWKRDAEDTPFLREDSSCEAPDAEFMNHVDLRGMFIDGFTFDSDTAQWWTMQSDDAKRAVLDSDGEDCPCRPIEDVVKGLFVWVDDIKRLAHTNEVCLWSQGTDFDIAILRNICSKYGMPMPCKYNDVRDHRTYYMESARMMCTITGDEFNFDTAYSLFEAYTEPGVVHDPVYDCKRSIYSTWQMMKKLKALLNDKR